MGKAENAIEAYKILHNQNIDLMFLDIQMPHLNGIDFLKSLSQKPKTVFTTAYRDFAIEGFELEAVDYILKPITFDRFFKAVERVLRNKTDPDEDYIIIRTNAMYRKIALPEIVYFESCGNDIKIFLHTNECLVSKTKITDLEVTLTSKGFVRIHRSFIINSHYVKAFNHHEILIDKYRIPVGRSYKKGFDVFISGLSKNKLI
ncbi:LytR/AlgR family response regulator transcription factor [Chryseobacterium sp. P1-3]|uniref:LytR/AlgR family response regulator transcription factor n=1 Tax=Chryseobacterium sp. (strain P1-3) TaxID=1517683 RepID=UPI000B243E84|nr:LytTR family DNA-binding domain-containing protein [Chryseobacterium sp. P1-3]